MKTVYETSHMVSSNPYRTEEREFASKQEAKTWIENNANGNGRIITWIVRPNLPNLLPEMVYNSCALDVCVDGVWKGVNIHE